ncbi:MAG TPA: peptidyl-prolyl cis-trans isomerase [Acidobacteriaceae bacterium]|nr:peptidyl-prolyl cis-trans isomerase [Acidobacteriaceae bacterium]
MILRFTPSRLAVFSAVLATGLIFFFPIKSIGQNTKSPDLAPYPGTPVEEIIARVNDEVISTSDYQRALEDLDQQSQQHQWTEQQLYDQKANLLRDLIDQQLLLSRGKDLGITGETELIKELDEMRKQNHLATMDDLQKAAESQGVNWEDFKASLRNRIITQEVIREEVGSRINITPTEENAYYQTHKDEFMRPEEVRLSEILIPTADPDNAAQVAQAQKKADEAEAKLKAGADFAKLTESISAGVTASSGGDLGIFRRGQLAKVLEDQTFDLKPGQFTEPIRTKQGYVILKVTQHTPGGIAPLKDVEPQVENDIGMEKMAPALRSYLTHLRENAYIAIMNGYQDTGASPNEMKPVYSAYTPPTKKKKKEQRTRFRQRRRKPQVETVAETKTVTSGKQELGTMKPGKREKIRFGQAPRETLPPAQTATEQAGPNALGTQVAANNLSSGLTSEDQGGPAAQPEAKPKKVRFSDEARHHKKKQKGPKVDPFAPPPPTKLEVATREQQDQPLGLNGDTSKIKKKNPRKEGPKRRWTDEEKKKEDKSATPSSNAASTAPTGSSDQQ